MFKMDLIGSNFVQSIPRRIFKRACCGIYSSKIPIPIKEKRISNIQRAIMFQYFICVFILATIISILEASQEEYRMYFTTFNLTDIQVAKSSASLAMCAALCSQETVCGGFARRRGECALLKRCPRSYSAVTEKEDGWTVHCPESKI